MVSFFEYELSQATSYNLVEYSDNAVATLVRIPAIAQLGSKVNSLGLITLYWIRLLMFVWVCWLLV